MKTTQASVAWTTRSVYFYQNGNCYVQINHEPKDIDHYVGHTISVKIAKKRIIGKVVSATGCGLILENWTIKEAKK